MTVSQGAVWVLHSDAQVRGQSCQFVVGDIHDPAPRQCQGVNETVTRDGATDPLACSCQKSLVKGGIVTDQGCIADEFQVMRS